MTFNQLVKFIGKINALPDEQRDAVRLMFHNPTDAAVAAFVTFVDADNIEQLDNIIQTAKLLGVDNAEHLEDAFVEWCNTESNEDACPRS